MTSVLDIYSTDDVLVAVQHDYSDSDGVNVPLRYLMDGGTVHGSTVYRWGAHCAPCAYGQWDICPYVAATYFSVDGGLSFNDAPSHCDGLPLPVCPVAQAVAMGKLTWADVHNAAQLEYGYDD